MTTDATSKQPIRRVGRRAVALETTLLAHGIPRAEAAGFARELNAIVADAGATPAVVGIVDGRPIVGLSDAELGRLLERPDVAKVNTSNLGVIMHRGECGATTVSTTVELAARVGVSIFATGGIGGVHRGYGERLDISSDLAAIARHPVAVVTSGVKSLLDVVSTREALETLGVPVIGFRCDRFPAFYTRDSDASVDARFDDVEELASFIRLELSRSVRGMVVANPIPVADEIDAARFELWLKQAEQRAGRTGSPGRSVTPAILSALHEVSAGATLHANLTLVRSNVKLAAALATAMEPV